MFRQILRQPDSFPKMHRPSRALRWKSSTATKTEGHTRVWIRKLEEIQLILIERCSLLSSRSVETAAPWSKTLNQRYKFAMSPGNCEEQTTG
jgi:hypothetical protein